MIKVGQKVIFDPWHGIHGSDVAEVKGERKGRIIYVNDEHRYFTASYEINNRKWLTSFKFTDVVGIGSNGHVKIVKEK